MEKKIFREGDEIVGVCSDQGHPGYNTHRPRLYEAVARQKDGVVIWKMVLRLGDSWRHSEDAVKQAKAIAQELDLPFRKDIRHGDPLDKANA